MRRAILAMLLLAFAATLAGCAGRSGPLRIGATDRVEQRILASMLKQLAESAGSKAVIVSCGTTVACWQGLLQERIDLMPAYSGAGQLALQPARRPEDTGYAAMRGLFQGGHVRWIAAFGFSSGFVLTAPARGPGVDQPRTIADLASFRDGVRFAVSPDYLRRPLDGLYALIRRHGLKLAADPLALADPAARLGAVREGRADLAVLRRTDAALVDASPPLLEDEGGFFPRYDAGIVARAALVETRPAVVERLRRLSGRLDAEAMRRLNYAVAFQGRPPSGGAFAFLREHGLIDRGVPAPLQRSATRVYWHGDPALSGFAARARQAVTALADGQPVELVTDHDPLGDLVAGRARFAVVTAAALTGRLRRGALLDSTPSVEAATLLGVTYLHVVRRVGSRTRDPLYGRLGLPVTVSRLGLAAEQVATRLGKRPTLYATTDKLLEALAERRIDVALVFAAPGDPRIAGLLGEGKAVLRAPPQRLFGDAPLPAYLSEAALPAGSYAGQDQPLHSLGMQVVLASPAPAARATLLSGGPAGALLGRRRALTLAEAETLSGAIKAFEPPSPVLPTVWSRHLRAGESRSRGTALIEGIDTMLNFAVLAFLIWAIWLAIRPSEAGRER